MSLPRCSRELFGAFAWLFAALSMMALLSQPGASHDELIFHAPSIFCADGVRAPSCTRLDQRAGSVFEAYTNLEGYPCKKLPTEPLWCPSSSEGWNGTLSNINLYPSGFFRFLNWFLVPSAGVSVFLARTASSLVVTTILGLSMWLLPKRYRVALFLVMLTSLTGTGFFLFSSINPSSWTALGVGIGWLSVHASLAPSEAGPLQRLLLGLLGVTSWLLALVSRVDAPVFISVTAGLSAVHVVTLRSQWSSKKKLLAVTAAFVLLLAVLDVTSVIRPLPYLMMLYEYARGGQDNSSLLSSGLLETLPNSLSALGTVPTHSFTPVFQIVFILAIMLLGLIMTLTFNYRARFWQLVGCVMATFSMTVASLSQVNLVGNRSTGSEARYLFPLLMFGIGWWYLLGPYDITRKVAPFAEPASKLVAVMFALTSFSVAERFVDIRSGGLRYIPESPDVWWWPWMPVGPNIVVIVGSTCMYFFFSRLSREVFFFVGERAEKR